MHALLCWQCISTLRLPALYSNQVSVSSIPFSCNYISVLAAILKKKKEYYDKEAALFYLFIYSLTQELQTLAAS